MEISEQKMTVNLPTLLIDSRSAQVTATEPGLEAMGYSAVPGELECGFRLENADDDPSQIRLTVRLLAAHYSPPTGCSDRVLEIVNQVNQEIAARIRDAV